MSVTVTRIGTPFPGKQDQAHAFAEDRAEAARSKFGTDSKVMLRIGGPVGQVVMVTEFASLAEFDEKKRELIRATLAGDFPTAPDDVFQSVEEHIWLTKSS